MPRCRRTRTAAVRGGNPDLHFSRLSHPQRRRVAHQLPSARKHAADDGVGVHRQGPDIRRVCACGARAVPVLQLRRCDVAVSRILKKTLRIRPVIVYLDQNKWIELAKIFHGKDKEEKSKKILLEFNAAVESGVKFPLSAMHYIELSRVSNDGRRSRLGKVMWKYSKGITLACYRDLLLREIEVAFTQVFPEIIPRPMNLLGRGVAHAFGEKFNLVFPEKLDEIFEESILAGSEWLDVPPAKGNVFGPRSNFFNHLQTLHERKNQLPKSKWDDWLYAISTADIVEPLNEVLSKHGLHDNISKIFADKDSLKRIVDAMPTRSLDLHLHRQIIRNPSYRPKENDLEDWAGVGVASCYCDVVVCEKHLADMLRRDSYRSHARIETDLAAVFVSIF